MCPGGSVPSSANGVSKKIVTFLSVPTSFGKQALRDMSQNEWAPGVIILQPYHRPHFLTRCGIIDLLHFLQPEKLTGIDHLGLDCFIEGASSLCRNFITVKQPFVTDKNALLLFFFVII